MGKSWLLGQLGKVKLEKKKGYLKSDEQKLNLGFCKPSQASVKSRNERLCALRTLATLEGSCVASRARGETFDKAKVGVMW